MFVWAFQCAKHITRHCFCYNILNPPTGKASEGMSCTVSIPILASYYITCSVLTVHPPQVLLSNFKFGLANIKVDRTAQLLPKNGAGGLSRIAEKLPCQWRWQSNPRVCLRELLSPNVLKCCTFKGLKGRHGLFIIRQSQIL